MSVTLLLHDFHPSSITNQNFIQLKQKFTNQTKGKFKFIQNRLGNNSTSGLCVVMAHLPIEFAHDKYYICKFLQHHLFKNEFVVCDEWFDERVDVFFDRIKRYGLLDYSIRTRDDDFCKEILNYSDEFINQLRRNEEKAYEFNNDDETEEIIPNHANVDLQDKNSILNDLKKRSDGYIFKDISATLKSDQEFVLKALEYCTDASILEFIDPTLKKNRDFILQAVKINPYSILHASHSLRNDFEIGKETVLLNPDCFRYLSISLRSNEELAMIALKELPFIWRYLGEDLDNTEFAMKVIEHVNAAVIKYFPHVTEQIEIAAVKASGFYLNFKEHLLKERINHEYFGAKLF